MSVVWDIERPKSIDCDGPTQRPFDPIDAAWIDRGLIGRFEHICSRFPDRIAIDDGTVQLTYGNLRARAYALAETIAREAPAGRPVAAVIPGSAVYPVALLACLAAGTPLAPVDVTHPVQRKSAILSETDPGLVLLAEGFEPEPGLIADGTPRLQISLAGTVPQPSAPPSPPLDSLAGVAFTSGSTGRPKGLAYGQDDMFDITAEFVNSLHVYEDDVILALASLGAGGNLNILSAITTGARVRMLDIKASGIEGVLRVIRAEGVTLLSMIPLVFRSLFQAPGAKEAVASLRAIATGGDRLLGSDIALFRKTLPEGCAIRATQGSTETGVVFHWIVPKDAVFGDQETVPSGYLGLGKAVGLVGAEGDTPGVFEGEFLVRGRRLARGGWQGGQLTPGPFLTDPEDPSQKIYDTGDVVRRSASGLYEFVGRRDRQIKILGLRADPGDVEAILRKTPGVGDVVVIVRRTGSDAVFVAYVVPADLHSPPEPEALQRAVAAEAPPHLTPAEVRFIPAVPRLPSYKPDLVALEALDRVNQPRPAIEEPARASEDADIADAVRRAWTATLGRETYAADRPWMLSGGDSVKALQFMLRVEEWLGRKIPLFLFDSEMSPSGMVAKLSEHFASVDEAASEGPLVFFCPGIAGDDTRLARFRAELSPTVRFELIEYPDLEHSVAELSDPGFLYATAMAQIERACPQGPVRLAGYSLGGLVAYDLAVQLAAKGRVVERLCILDTAASVRDAGRWDDPREAGGFAAFVANLRATGLAAAAQEFIIKALLRRGAFRLLRRLILLKNQKPGHRSVYARRVLLERLRGRGFLDWRPGRYAGDLWLLRAEQQRNRDAPADLEWSALVDRLHVLPIPGDHKSMLDPPHLRLLCAAFVQAIGAPAEGAHEARA